MKDGYIRAAAMTPKIKVADCRYNTEQIKELITKAYDNKAAIVSFPELCITGYTCNDLFLQDTLIDEAYNSLIDLKKYSMKEWLLLSDFHICIWESFIMWRQCL